VAQPGSALDWGSRGRRFESCHPDQFLTGGRPGPPKRSMGGDTPKTRRVLVRNFVRPTQRLGVGPSGHTIRLPSSCAEWQARFAAPSRWAMIKSMGTAKPKGKPGDKLPTDTTPGDEIPSTHSGARISPDEPVNPLHQLITDVRSQSRQPARWQPFPDPEPTLRACDPVAQKLSDARRSVTQIILEDRGDRI
jgi:hypothetical protein